MKRFLSIGLDDGMVLRKFYQCIIMFFTKWFITVGLDKGNTMRVMLMR